MKRQIKFRAWDGKIMMNQVNILLISENAAYPYNRKMIHNSMQWDEEGLIYNPIFMQFTGLKDGNGVDIYEADIIDTGSGSLTHVGFKNGGFYYINYYSITDLEKNDEIYFGGHNWLKEILGRFKVIGNIYENPELLSVKQHEA